MEGVRLDARLIDAMTRSRQTVRQLLAALVTILLCPLVASAQVNQSKLAQQIRGGDYEDRDLAVGIAAKIPPRKMNDGLRLALIAALEAEIERVDTRSRELRAGADGEPLGNPEFVAVLSRLVVPLGDKRSIPALVGAMRFAPPASDALTAFGELAAPHVLEVVMDPRSFRSHVDTGLIALRYMIEQPSTDYPLTASTLDSIRKAARLHLLAEDPLGTGMTMRWAIDLAIALDDPKLRRIVESLASDPAAARAREVNRPDRIKRTQQRARDRLAGIKALPRPPAERP